MTLFHTIGNRSFDVTKIGRLNYSERFYLFSKPDKPYQLYFNYFNRMDYFFNNPEGTLQYRDFFTNFTFYFDTEEECLEIINQINDKKKFVQDKQNEINREYEQEYLNKKNS